MRRDEQRHFAVRGKHVWAGNGILPLGENTFGRATAFCHSWKTRRGEKRRFSVRGKYAGASNGVSPFEENAFGRGKPFWVEAAFALGKHHQFGFSEKSRNFRKNTAWTCQKPSGGTYSCIVFQACIFCYTFLMISDDLRKIISERDIKQKDICKALGLSQSYTSELLSGKKEFSLDLLEKLCDFLQVDIRLVDKYRQ